MPLTSPYFSKKEEKSLFRSRVMPLNQGRKEILFPAMMTLIRAIADFPIPCRSDRSFSEILRRSETLYSFASTRARRAGAPSPIARHSPSKSSYLDTSPTGGLNARRGAGLFDIAEVYERGGRADRRFGHQ